MNQWKIKTDSLIYIMLILVLLIPRRYMIAGKMQIYLLVILAAAFVTALYKDRLITKKISIFFGLPCTVYLICTILSYGVHGDFVPLALKLIEYFGLAYIVIRYAPNNFQKICDILCYLIGTLAILGIIQTVTGINVFDPANQLAGGGANSVRFGLQRCYGPFTTSINFGLFLMIGECFIAYVLNRKSSKHHKMIRCFYILVWICNICTLSRTAIGVMLISQILMAIMCGYLKKVKKAIRGSVTLMILAAVLIFSKASSGKMGLLINQIIDSFMVITADEGVVSEYGFSGGVADRDDLWRWIDEKVDDKKIFGLGENEKFSIYLNRWRTKTSIENTYLSIYYHHGIVGVFGFLVLILGIIGYIICNRKKRIFGENELTLSMCLLIISLIYFFAALSVGIMDEQRLYIILLGSWIGVINQKIPEIE